jgi:sugar/nucleoside kinase (ribokinase family)
MRALRRSSVAQQVVDVVAVGSAIVDVIAHTEDAFLVDMGMAKGSMSLVDEERADELYGHLGPAQESSGGSAANTVACVASMGGTAGFIGKVADDQLGEVFAHDIRSIGVDFETPPSVDGPATARCLIMVTPDAQRTMHTYLGAASTLVPADIAEAFVQRAGIVYCEGYLWDLPAAKDAIRVAMDHARAVGARTSFTLSDEFCVDRHRAEFLDLIEAHVDVLFANEREILSLYETEDWVEAVGKVAGHCDLACLTRSEKGSVIVTPHEMITIEAEPIDELVDTTGAGDAYAAGVLLGLARGVDLPTAGRMGAIAASEVITHLGARPLVSLADLVADRLG